MVGDRASSYKIDYVIVIKNFLNPVGHQNPISGLKVTAILIKGGCCLLVKLHREGSAPAASAAGFFVYLHSGIVITPSLILSESYPKVIPSLYIVI